MSSINSASNNSSLFNLPKGYSLFQKKDQDNPLNVLLQNNGNKPKLPKTDKNSLDSVDHEYSRFSAQRTTSIQQQANLQRVVTHNGNQSEIYTRSTVQTQSQTQMRSELESQSSQLVTGTVNGKKVYLNAEKDVNQTVTEDRNATTEKNQASTEIIARNAAKEGNVTQYTTTHDTAGQGDFTSITEADRKAETEVQSRTYNQDGTLKSSQYSNQAVTTNKDVTVTQNWQATGDREIDKTVTATSEKNGKQTIKEVDTATIDIASGNRAINTTSQTTTNSLVEKFDKSGNLLSAAVSSQQATTTEARTIDSSRATATEQSTRTVNGPGLIEKETQSQYVTKAVTVNKTDADTLIQNFNAAGALTGQRTSERETTIVTTEKLAGESVTRSASTVKNGSNVSTTEIKANTKSDVEIDALYNQDGKLSKRAQETEISGSTYATVENRLNPNGQRIVNLESLQTTSRDTSDLTIGANKEGRLVETSTESLQAVDGKLNFNPGTGQIGTNAAPGAIVIDVGTNTGIRSSFKLEYGTLKFDFTAVRMTATEQATTTGKVTPGLDDFSVKGTQTAQASVVAEEIRFKGEIISSVDEAGNRVIELKADLTDQGIGALAVNNKQGVQTEEGKANIDINGKLTINRETVVEGNKTSYKSTAQAELELNKVEKTEGANVKSLTPLSTSDGFKAGLIADYSALRFNFGMFNFGISFVG